MDSIEKGVGESGLAVVTGKPSGDELPVPATCQPEHRLKHGVVGPLFAGPPLGMTTRRSSE